MRGKRRTAAYVCLAGLLFFMLMKPESVQGSMQTDEGESRKAVKAAQIETEEEKEEENEAKSTAGGTRETDEENEKKTESVREEAEKLQETLLQEMELDKIEDSVRELLEGVDFSFADMLTGLLSGEEQLGAETLGELFGQVLTGSLLGQKKVMAQLVLLVLACAFLSTLSGLFEDGQLWETSFYTVYLLVFVLLVGAFSSVSRNLESTLKALTSFMRAVTPAYYLAVAAANGAGTAAMFYQMVLMVIAAAEHLLAMILLPAVRFYVLLAMINHLSKEEFLSHMTELMETGISWALKTTLGLLVGLQIIRSLIAPALDAFRRTVLGKTASAIPGVGNAVNAVTEMVIGSAVLIRNCFGVTALLVLLLAGLYPVAELAMTSLACRLLAAFAQPVCDKRICSCLATAGKGYALLLRLLLTVEALFLLTIAILAGTYS